MKRTGPSRRNSTKKTLNSTPNFTIDDLVDDVFKLVMHYVPTYSRMGYNTVHTVSKKWNRLLNEITNLEHRNKDTLIASCQDDVDAWLLLNDEAFLENAEFMALLQVTCKDERILEEIIEHLTPEELNLIGKRDNKIARRLLTDYSYSSRLISPLSLMGHYPELAIPHLHYSLETLNAVDLVSLSRHNAEVASALLKHWGAIKPEMKPELIAELIVAYSNDLLMAFELFETCKGDLHKYHFLDLGSKHSSLAQLIIDNRADLKLTENEIIDSFSNHLDVAKRFMNEFRDKLSDYQFIDLCIKHPALYREHKNEFETLLMKYKTHDKANKIFNDETMKARFENANNYVGFVNALGSLPTLKLKFTGNLLHDEPIQRKNWIANYLALLKNPKYISLFNSKALCTLCLDDFEAGMFILKNSAISKNLKEVDLKKIANHRIAYADVINSKPELRKKLNHFLSNGLLQISMLAMTHKSINDPQLDIFLAKRYLQHAKRILIDEVLRYTIPDITRLELVRRVSIYDKIIRKRDEINATKKNEITEPSQKKSRLK